MAAKIMGILREFILSLHQARAKVVIMSNALFGITSKFELNVP
jgi:hypothetical protein